MLQKKSRSVGPGSGRKLGRLAPIQGSYFGSDQMETGGGTKVPLPGMYSATLPKWPETKLHGFY